MGHTPYNRVYLILYDLYVLTWSVPKRKTFDYQIALSLSCHQKFVTRVTK